MTERDISRRSVLRGVSTGVVGMIGAGGLRDRGGGEVRRYSVGASKQSAVRAASERARTVRRVLDFDTIGTSVVGEFTADEAMALVERDGVRYVQEAVELDLVSASQTGQSNPWGVDRIDADVAHANGHTGRGVDVAVLDSGIAVNHPDLRRNLGDGRAFVDCVSGVAVRCTVDPRTGRPRCETRVRRCRQDWGDDVPQGGHGTHVAGIVGAADNDRGVLGIAPEATLHSVKVASATGSAPDSIVAAGLKFAADQGWDVVNMSLGGLRARNVLRDAVEYAVERDVVLIAAAGNQGPDPNTVSFPGRHPDVLAVSATTRHDRVARFSSRGENVDVAAPGADVCSTVRGGEQSSISGTSMATPHVAGAAALLVGDGLSTDEVRSRLVDTAEDIGLPSIAQGAGLIDVAAALEFNSADDGFGNGMCNLPRRGG